MRTTSRVSRLSVSTARAKCDIRGGNSNARRLRWFGTVREGWGALLTCVLLLCMRAPALGGAVVTWIGPDGGQWSASSNWDLGRVPFAADDPLINKGNECLITTSGAVGNEVVVEGLSPSSKSTLRVEGDYAALEANGLTVGVHGILTIDGGSVRVGSFDSTSGGFNHYDGTLTVSGGSFDDGGTNLAVDGGTAGALAEVVLDGAVPTSTYGGICVGTNAGGMLTLSGGTVLASSGEHSYIGSNSGSEGMVIVEGAGTEWTTDEWDEIEIGSDQRATGALIVRDGGSLGGALHVRVGSKGQGSLTVTGPGSELSIPRQRGQLNIGTQPVGTGSVVVSDGGHFDGYRIEVGESGPGSLTVTGGASVESKFGWIGTFASGVGDVVVDAASWSMSEQLVVGKAGEGTLKIENGATVTSSGCTVGFQAGGVGRVIVSGPGSLWSTTWVSIGGNSGTGSVSVLGQAEMRVAGTLRVTEPDSSLTIDGAASVTAQSFRNNGDGAFNFHDGTLTVDGGDLDLGSTTDLVISGHDAASNPTLVLKGATPSRVYDEIRVGDSKPGSLTARDGTVLASSSHTHLGYDAGGDGSATITGPGSRLDVGDILFVGRYGNGDMTVKNCASLTMAEGRIGRQSGSTGSLTITGVGSSLTSAGPLTIGGTTTAAGGNGALIVADGATASAGDMRLWHRNDLVHVDGGSLTVARLQGDAGTVRLTDPTSGTALTLGGGTFDGNVSDGASGPGSIVKTGTGTLRLQGMVSYTGTTDVAGGAMTVPNGMGTPGGAVTVAAGAELRAGNIVNRAVSGEGTITALGDLLIGDMTSANGYEFAGMLHVGANNVLLLDSDAALLGQNTTIEAGGKLGGLNGIQLGPAAAVDPTKTLTASGSAVIDGAFRNNGTVNGPTGSEWLTFIDDVTGAGSYTGNIAFSDSFSPGNSAAVVHFQNLQLNSATELLMEIGGETPGTGHDRIVVGENVCLGGVLTVELIGAWEPKTGDRYDLFDWGTSTGGFSALNLPALSDGREWDTSAIEATGVLSVIPEPTGLALLLSGAALLFPGRQKRRL